MIELHCHTTCSDGQLTPAALVKAAATAGIRVLAITDHDTLAGWAEAREAAQGYGLEIIPGIELSTTSGGHPLHLLGFFPHEEKLLGPLQERQDQRRYRAAAMVDRLAAMGFPVQLPSLAQAPGRPHIAQALVKAGHVRSVREAFDRFLRDNGPAYIPYAPFSAVAGVRLLRSCGAVPVWAHPGLFRGGGLVKTLSGLVEAGLLGLEVYHPEQDLGLRRTLLRLCDHYGLIATGGSDYHGPNPRGYHLNMMQLDLALYQDLLASRNRIQSDPSSLDLNSAKQVS